MKMLPVLVFLAGFGIWPAMANDDDDRRLAKDILERAGVPRGQVEAQDAWERCTEQAVDKFALQSEPAETVAIAAI